MKRRSLKEILGYSEGRLTTPGRSHWLQLVLYSLIVSRALSHWQHVYYALGAAGENYPESLCIVLRNVHLRLHIFALAYMPWWGTWPCDDRAGHDKAGWCKDYWNRAGTNIVISTWGCERNLPAKTRSYVYAGMDVCTYVRGCQCEFECKCIYVVYKKEIVYDSVYVFVCVFCFAMIDASI